MNHQQFKLESTEEFERKLKRLLKKNQVLQKKVVKALSQLEQDPFYPSLNSHKIHHRVYGAQMSSWVTEDLRIIWNYRDPGTIILLMTIGGHEGGNKIYH